MLHREHGFQKRVTAVARNTSAHIFAIKHSDTQVVEANRILIADILLECYQFP